jgi:hypothetical protein
MEDFELFGTQNQLKPLESLDYSYKFISYNYIYLA